MFRVPRGSLLVLVNKQCLGKHQLLHDQWHVKLRRLQVCIVLMFTFLTEPISLLGLQALQENQVLRRDLVRREHLGKFQHVLGSQQVQPLDWKIVPVLFRLGIQQNQIQQPRISTRNYQQVRHGEVFSLHHHIDLQQKRIRCRRAFRALERFSPLVQRLVSIRVYQVQSISTLSMKILSVGVLFCLVLILWFATLSPKQNHSSFLFRQLKSAIA